MRFLAGRVNYERAASMPNSEAAFKLDRMRELLRRLGNPHEGPVVLHVAGTKGKGSTAAMLASILTAAGLRTGRFTSPHLERVEERIAVDGHPCSAEEFAELIDEVRPVVELMDREAGGPAPMENNSPTYFEILTAMAWRCFARRRVDAVVLEVGLGGRLDSTNICRPSVAILTSISFDHTRQLGETLAAIAAEKAGIIKPGVPVVSGVVEPEPRDVIRQAAAENGCRLVELDADFHFQYDPPIHLERGPSPARFRFLAGRDIDRRFALNLLGRHQAANAAVAIAAVEELRRLGLVVPDAAIERGLAEVAWPARVEVVSQRPTVVLDAAHNTASVRALVESLDESFSARRRLLIFATTQEKDLHGMLRQLVGRFDAIFFTRYTDNPRAVPPEELLRVAEAAAIDAPTVDSAANATDSTANTAVLADFAGSSASGEDADRAGLGGATGTMEIASTPADAWAAARRRATADDLICITGSFFLAAEMRRIMTEWLPP